MQVMADHVCYGLNYIRQNSDTEALTPYVPAFGDGPSGGRSSGLEG